MRGSFRKELKKFEKFKRSGASSDDQYVPSLWYFDLLMFTREHETATESFDNIVGSPSFPEYNSASQTVDDSDRGNCNGNSQTCITENEESSAVSEKENEIVGRNETIFKTPVKRKKPKLLPHEMQQQIFMKTCTDALQKCGGEETESTAFGKFVAAKHMKLNETQKMYAETLITKILHKAALNQLTEDTGISESQAHIRPEPSLWYFKQIEYVFDENDPRPAVDSLEDVAHQEPAEEQNMEKDDLIEHIETTYSEEIHKLKCDIHSLTKDVHDRESHMETIKKRAQDFEDGVLETETQIFAQLEDLANKTQHVEELIDINKNMVESIRILEENNKLLSTEDNIRFSLARDINPGPVGDNEQNSSGLNKNVGSSGNNCLTEVEFSTDICASTSVLRDPGFLNNCIEEDYGVIDENATPKSSCGNPRKENRDLKEQILAMVAQLREDFLRMMGRPPQTEQPEDSDFHDALPQDPQPQPQPQDGQATRTQEPASQEPTTMEVQQASEEPWTMVQSRKKRRAPTSSSSSEEDEPQHKPANKPASKRRDPAPEPGTSKHQDLVRQGIQPACSRPGPPTETAEDIADVIKTILRQQQQQQEQTNALIAKLFNQIQAQK
nr:unnamed protein product [Callosobruchus analis]